MPGSSATEELEITGLGSGGPPGPPGGDASGDSSGAPAGLPARVYYTGISMALAAILMFFMALVSAYIVRKTAAGDWQPVPLPRLLWLNTLVLLASSVTIEAARRHLRALRLDAFRHWWGLTSALGLLFLLGQVLAWRQLAAAGVFLASNPASSFFYLLTGAHALHLLGGVTALLYVAMRNWRQARVSRSTAAEVASIYWHFMDGLWVFLFLLLLLGR